MPARFIVREIHGSLGAVAAPVTAPISSVREKRLRKGFDHQRKAGYEQVAARAATRLNFS
jgi:hypothetical protein